MAEREITIERIVRVYVPAEQMRELLEDNDGITNYIIRFNTQAVIKGLRETGWITSDSPVMVRFAASENLDRDSSERKLKYIEIYRNEEGEIVDADIKDGMVVLDIPTYN